MSWWRSDDPVSSSPDLADEPALAWRDDLPAHRHGPAVRWRDTPASRKWTAVLAAAALSGPFAIVAALVENSTTGAVMLVTVVVLAPLIEESLKGAGALYLAEVRPWLVPTAAALPVVTLVSGLVFAAVENWWYLAVLIDDPPARLVTWRWIFGPLVHGLGSFVVGLGAARVWRRAMDTDTTPSFAAARPFVIAAAAWHGLYNAFAFAFELTGGLD